MSSTLNTLRYSTIHVECKAIECICKQQRRIIYMMNLQDRYIDYAPQCILCTSKLAHMNRINNTPVEKRVKKAGIDLNHDKDKARTRTVDTKVSYCNRCNTWGHPSEDCIESYFSG